MPHGRRHTDWVTRVAPLGVKLPYADWAAWPPAMRAEVLNSRAFWNALCAVWEAREAAYRAVVLTVPALASLWDAVEQTRATELAGWQALRHGGKAVLGPSSLVLSEEPCSNHNGPRTNDQGQMTTDHAAARQAARQAWQAFQRARRAHREALAAPVQQLTAAFQAGCKAAYAAAPLSPYNKSWVQEAFFTTCQKRLQGKGGAPTPQHGRVRRAHFEYQYRQGGLPVAQMFGPDQRHFRLEPFHGTRRTPATLRIAADYWLEFVAIQHHRAPPLPPEALLKRVVLVGEEVHPEGLKRRPDGTYGRLKGVWHWELRLVLEHPPLPAPQHASPRACALDVGYRLLDDDTVRLAVYVDRPGFSPAQEVRLPTPLLATWRQQRALQAVNDQTLEHCKAQLVTLLGGQTLPPELAATMAQHVRLRAGGLRRVRRLLLGLEQPAGALLEALVLLTQWEAVDTQQRRRLRKLDLTLHRRRQWEYLQQAHALCRAYHTIVLEELDWRPLARTPTDPRLAEAAKYRQLVAPSLWRQALRQVAPKYGTTLQEVDPAYTTVTCWHCGAMVEQTGALWLECPNGHRTDQDHQAALNLYRQAFASTGADSTRPGDARGRK